MNAAPIQSYEEAERLLKLHRGYLIAFARYVGGRIASQVGVVDTRKIFEALDDAGVLDKFPNVREHYWMGVIFNCDYFEWATSPCCGIGRTFIWNDPERNIHQRMIKVWKLSDPTRLPPHPGPAPQ